MDIDTSLFWVNLTDNHPAALNTRNKCVLIQNSLQQMPHLLIYNNIC